MVFAIDFGEPCDDEANNDKVIQEMKEVDDGDRGCRFRCVLALVGNWGLRLRPTFFAQ